MSPDGVLVKLFIAVNLNDIVPDYPHFRYNVKKEPKDSAWSHASCTQSGLESVNNSSLKQNHNNVYHNYGYVACLHYCQMVF